MQLTKSIMALAAFVLVAQATPLAPETLDLRAVEGVKCSTDHEADSDSCRDLISRIGSTPFSITSHDTRSTCTGGCCISWSKDADFSSSDLANSASSCFNVCANTQVSCQTQNAVLGDVTLDVCVSNRATGCT